MGMNEAVSISCNCGQVHAIREIQAGSQIRCSCGRSVDVPSLGNLRQLAGKEAYVTNPAEAIRKSVAQGIEPAGNSCLVCGSDVSNTYRCVAECERSLTKDAQNNENSLVRFLARLISVILIPKLLVIYLFSRPAANSEPQVFGHDVAVEFQLPVCEQCAQAGHDPRKHRVARKMLQEVDLLNQLLEYYPAIALRIERLE